MIDDRPTQQTTNSSSAVVVCETVETIDADTSDTANTPTSFAFISDSTSAEPQSVTSAYDCSCCFEDQPTQPSNASYDYNLTAKQCGSQIRKMDTGWYAKWRWLTFCKQRAAVLRTQCRWMTTGNKWPPGLKIEPAFSAEGFSSWQVATAKFRNHEQSVAHGVSTTAWMRKEQPTAATLLAVQHAANQTERSRSLFQQLEALRYLARQGMAIRGHTEDEGNLMQLITLRSHDSPRLVKWLESGRYMSHDMVSEQLHHLSIEVLRPLLQEIRHSPCFSVIADETRDISGHEQFSISIRWIGINNEVREDFVGLVDVPNTDSATLADVIMDVLLRCNLDKRRLVGQAYDGASNMAGRLNGVAARIAADYLGAMFIHCNNHCLQLCVQDAGSESICVREALNLCTNLYNLIKLSPKRLAVFEEIQKLHQGSQTSIKPLCPTRWTVRATAISSILTNYDVLLDTLDAIMQENKRNETAAKASGIAAQMEKFDIIAGLYIAKLLFSTTDQAATMLHITAAEANGIINSLKAHLGKLRDEFEAVWSDIIKNAEQVGIEVSAPRQRKLSRKLDETRTQHMFSSDDPQAYYQQQYFAVIDSISGELSRRFSQSAMKTLEFFETIILDAANDRLQSLKTDSAEAVETLSVYGNIIDLQKLDSQLRMLPSVIATVNEEMSQRDTSFLPVKQMSSVRSATEILTLSSFAKNLCSEVYNLCIIYLTVPMTSATAERSFSTMRRIKTYLRQTMGQQRLNDLMLLHIHKQRTDEINIATVMRLFVNCKEERVRYFGVAKS